MQGRPLADAVYPGRPSRRRFADDQANTLTVCSGGRSFKIRPSQVGHQPSLGTDRFSAVRPAHARQPRSSTYVLYFVY